MSVIQSVSIAFDSFKQLILNGNLDEASQLLQELKAMLIDIDSLPPLCFESPNSLAEQTLARNILEYAVVLSIKQSDKDAFQRNISSLRPYNSQLRISESEISHSVLGCNLLHLLVENKPEDFHSELELLTDEQQAHPAIAFCTRLDRHLVVGSYDQVLISASNPPVPLYSFFLNSLLDSVRLNIGECITASYSNLTIEAATKILMFHSTEETIDFVTVNYPDWVITGHEIRLQASSTSKSEEIPALKLISQTLAYATELERIV